MQTRFLDIFSALPDLFSINGDRILDFGCGWGCVANYILAKFPNVQFTGINLSQHQCEYMRQSILDFRLTPRINAGA